ncbi:DNA-formamidopyrimidine glycosylase family protein [Nocardioides sp.]|uniref:DNA-formamidopyrimidine glycosylase family protein n=1 Tax=Nocardioides sp. TaxID=35761 RepID=UPI002622CF7F|nr:DNA-formamidopyrimidine glycosylase family protein [Nocardioides sp.]MDI6911138.1 DNA-formamidopyrimidine glycosylase family protein [Nocardioides sp.]
MPEGDAVWRTAERLRRALDGQRLVRTDLRVPQHATADLSGGTVVETVSRGKHLLTRIAHEQDWTLHTHLKMEGSWRVYRAGERWTKPAHLARVVLDVGSRSAVGFQLGVVDLLPREREDDVVGHLGPDLLGPDWDAEEAVRRLTADPVRPLGEALLDQRNLAGIGTIYRSELCFLTGYDPRDPVPVVADPLRLVRLAHSMLDRNRHQAQICTTGDKRRGRSLWVYGRSGERCLRCGTTIAHGQLGEPGRERVAYWCPACQPRR